MKSFTKHYDLFFPQHRTYYRLNNDNSFPETETSVIVLALSPTPLISLDPPRWLLDSEVLAGTRIENINNPEANHARNRVTGTQLLQTQTLGHRVESGRRRVYFPTPLFQIIAIIVGRGEQIRDHGR